MKCSNCKQEGHRKNKCTIALVDVEHTAATVETLPKTSTITREQAEKSANEWLPFIQQWLIDAIMDTHQHRDIGKMLANPTEITVCKWLNEKLGRPVRLVIGKSYDAITDDDGPKIRFQIKFRMGDWHLETTRRNSQKNSETSGTGHVAYRKEEFDVLLVFTPSSTFGIADANIRCIPVSALINPQKPDQLVTKIPVSIRRLYDTNEKCTEVIQSLCV